MFFGPSSDQARCASEALNSHEGGDKPAPRSSSPPGAERDRRSFFLFDDRFRRSPTMRPASSPHSKSAFHGFYRAWHGRAVRRRNGLKLVHAPLSCGGESVLQGLLLPRIPGERRTDLKNGTGERNNALFGRAAVDGSSNPAAHRADEAERAALVACAVQRSAVDRWDQAKGVRWRAGCP